MRLALVAVVVLALAGPAAAAPEPQGFWGGEYTTATGETVRVFSSPTYSVEQGRNQHWADFLASLLHGPELASVSLYLAPPAEVGRLCGGNPDVRGCYTAPGRIIALGDDAPDMTAASAVTHEYGHHVAASRSNAPWPALEWGPKRWATYLDVCRQARAHELWPGAEGPLLYQFNPGEGFAEAYRVLNQRRLGIPEPPWDVVDALFSPNARALALIEQDVVHPWTANTTATIGGRFGPGGKSVRSIKVATPLDGALSATVRGTPRLRLEARTGKRRLDRGGTNVAVTVCGFRTVTFRVTRLSGVGAFTLTVSRP